MEVVLLDSDDETVNKIQSTMGKNEDTANLPKIFSDTQVASIDSDSSIEQVEELQPKKR